MGRILRVGRGYFRSFQALQIRPQKAKAAAIGRLVSSLQRGELPGSEDFEALMLPVGVAWVRAVPGFSLWVFYGFDSANVTLLAIVDREPVRVD